MTQVSATVLLYGQAMALFQQLQDNFDAGLLRNVNDISSQLKNLLTSFEATAGTPILRFEPVADGEPPLSAKINRTYNATQYDVNILQNQVDVLRAGAIFTHNVITNEIAQATELNDQVANKMKTLQLYTGGVDSHTFRFGDSFRNNQFVDTSFTATDQQATIQNGFLTLGQQGSLVNLSRDATVTLLSDSNGFAGNNQEIEDPTTATVDSVTGQRNYAFVAQTNQNAQASALLDGQPNTVFEYEHYLVQPNNKASAGNFNFTYEEVDFSTGNAIGVASTQLTQIDWSNGPEGGVLQLDLQFDLGAVQRINYINYTPYGLDQNKNYPVLVTGVTTSADGNTWEPVSPNSIWVGTVSDLQAARTATNVTIGSAVWSFEVRSAQFIRLRVQQSHSIPCNIGHLYYTDRITQQRVEGPVPPLTNPALYYTPSAFSSSSAIQHKEYFVGRRWVIGIADFLVQQVTYQATSVYVTKPINVGGVVDRMSISADVYIPPSSSSNTSVIQFFISPDNGNNWYQISRIQDTNLGIPAVIAFNDPLPAQFRESGVAYFNTPKPVTSLRFKIQLFASLDDPTSTPIVQNYQLNVRLR